MDEILIAVIIPVYNSSEFLCECLDSLLKQKYENWVAYCIDDGSTDNSYRILSGYSEKDKRFRIFHKDNGGVSSARNFALEKIPFSEFTYISFLDSDDYIDSTMYLELVNLIKQNPDTDYVRLFSCPTSLRNYCLPEEQINYSFAKYSKSEYFANGEIGGFMHSLFIKSTIVQANEIRFPSDMTILEDQVFSIECALKSLHFILYRKRNYYYYQDNKNSLTKCKRDNSNDIISCINYLFESFLIQKDQAILNYFTTKYLPFKFQMLIDMRFKHFDEKLTKSLISDIKISDYLINLPLITRIKYHFLVFFKRL